MKMIAPVNFQAEDVQSSAPLSDNPLWEIVGRDFSEDWVDFIFDSVGDTLVLGLEDSEEMPASQRIRVYDLVTGEIKVSLSNEGLRRCQEIRISPDESRVAIVVQGRQLYVFSLETGNLLMQRSVFDTSTSTWRNQQKICWMPDSTGLLCLESQIDFGGVGEDRYYDYLLKVNTNNGSVLDSFSTYDVLRQIPAGGGSENIPEWGRRVSTLCFDLTESGYAIMVLSENDLDLGPYQRAFAVVRLNATTGASSYIWRLPPTGRTSSFDLQGFRVKGNADASQFLVYYALTDQRGLQVRADNAQLDFVSAPGLTDIYEGTVVTNLSQNSIKEEVCISKTTGVRHKRFASVGYSQRSDLDPVIGQVPFGVLYSAEYYVYAVESGGYRLLSLVDDTPVEQTNPSVLEGDVYTYQSRNYEALTDNSDRPDLGAMDNPPTWLDLGAVNPLRMFDGSISSVTTSPDTLTVQVKTSSVPKAVGLFNVQAATVRVQLLDQNDVEQFDTGELDMVDNTSIQDLNAYFFDGVTLSPDFVYTALPPYLEATVIVTLTPINGQVSVGEMVVGDVHYLGDTEFGTGVGILDFSRKERDQFGNFQIVERNFSKRANYIVSTPTRLASSVQQMLALYRAIPAVFIGAEERPETVVYGFYRSFDIVLEGPKFSSCNIEVEGLT